MIVKAFEIRDLATFIPVFAVQMVPHSGMGTADDPFESYLLSRAGYGVAGRTFSEPCVVLCRMEASGTARNATYDPYAWGGGRTFTVAHDYIIKHWDELKSGDVVDVEFILGETTEPKKSEGLS